MSEAVLIPCAKTQDRPRCRGRAIERHKITLGNGRSVYEQILCSKCARWSRRFDHVHGVKGARYEPIIYPYANPEHDVMIELFCIAVARLLFRSDEDVAILRAAGEAARCERRVA